MSTKHEKKWARYVQDRDRCSYSEALRRVRALMDCGTVPQTGEPPVGPVTLARIKRQAEGRS